MQDYAPCLVSAQPRGIAVTASALQIIPQLINVSPAGDPLLCRSLLEGKMNPSQSCVQRCLRKMQSQVCNSELPHMRCLLEVRLKTCQR